MLCLLRLLLRFLFRLGYLCPLLKHLLRMLLLQLLRRPDNMTFRRSNRSSRCHSSSLSYLLPPVRQRRWMTRLYLNLRPRNTKSKRRTMKSWLWILLIHCSRQILQCYLYLNTSHLSQQILKRVGQGAVHTVKFQRLLPFHIKINLMIRHVRLDKRKLLFPNHLLRHQIRLHGLLPWRLQSSTPTLPRHMDEYMLIR